MSGKLARVFGIVGGGLTLLPNLISIALYVYVLLLPIHSESQGYSYGLLIFTILPCLLSVTGFISSFLIRRKPFLTGVLMITCGLLMVFLTPISYAGIEEMMYENGIFIDTNIALGLIRIPPIMLTAAGIFSIVSRDTVSHRKNNIVQNLNSSVNDIDK